MNERPLYKVPYHMRVGGDYAPQLLRHQQFHSNQAGRDKWQVTKSRIIFVQIIFVIVFAGLFWRLADLTLAGTRSLHLPHAENAQMILRPDIVDRNGEVMGTNIQVSALMAKAIELRPNGTPDEEKIADIVAQLTSILPQFNVARANRVLRGKHYEIALHKPITRPQEKKILELGNPYLFLRDRFHRVYPYKQSMAHIIGFVDGQGQGRMGVERLLDERADAGSQITPSQIVLSIDLSIQHVVEAALMEAKEKYRAKMVAGAIMNVETGELIALSSLPGFDPNHPAVGENQTHYNHFTQGTYELGSVMKIFPIAFGLEKNIIEPTTIFDASTPFQVASGVVISDFHPQTRPLTIDEIITYSSNIGVAKMALTLPPTPYYEFLADLGFVARTRINLPERGRPKLPEKWDDVARAIASYGHGIAVTPLHVLVAGAAMVNGGYLVKPQILKAHNSERQRIISGQTSASLREMMRHVVVTGTAKKANIEGYEVIGKTGTADKPPYDGEKVVTSFFAAFPKQKPKYALLVVLDEPQPTDDSYGYNTAGWNAVPVAGKIIRKTTALLGLVPVNRERDDMPLAELIHYQGR